MSALDLLKEYAEQRLTLAVEEIFEFFQKTVTDYEVELDRYRKLLDSLFLPEIRLRREDVSSLTVKVKSCPEQQQQQHEHEHEIGPVLKQEEPQPPCIKEEQEEVWTSPWGEQFPGLQGPVVLNLPNISLKIEEYTEDGLKETSADVKDIKRSEPASAVPAPRDNSSLDTSQPQRKDTEDLSGLNRRNTCKARGGLVTCERGHTRQKPYGRPLQHSSDVSANTEEKPLRCSLCWECFSHPALLQQHMMSHGAEKLPGGSVCDRRSTETSQDTGHGSSKGN